jgi:hypothetical protein
MNATVKVQKGTVYADGTPVGTVEKLTHDGLWSTAYGIRSGGTEWVGTAPDGTTFSADTRKDAAAKLSRYAEPLSVTSVKVDHYMGNALVSASVSWQGNTACVSQYPEETFWVVDAFWACGAYMPTWSNGTGSRCTRVHVLKPEHAQAVDTAVAAARLSI